VFFIAVVMLWVFINVDYAGREEMSALALKDNDWRDDIFADVVADFNQYYTLLHEVEYKNDEALPVNADNRDEAVRFLRVAFSDELAQNIADYYLNYDPDGRLYVIPTDSIPLITQEDQSRCQITLITPQEANLCVVFPDCYAPGDEVRYTVRLKKDGKRWIICDLDVTTS